MWLILTVLVLLELKCCHCCAFAAFLSLLSLLQCIVYTRSNAHYSLPIIVLSFCIGIWPWDCLLQHSTTSPILGAIGLAQQYHPLPPDGTTVMRFLCFLLELSHDLWRNCPISRCEYPFVRVWKKKSGRSFDKLQGQAAFQATSWAPSCMYNKLFVSEVYGSIA